ncbi:MAG: EAL domain-containing protein [Curvibacter sp.]|nr:EAL domain-containing protein [Curvibacter sp.]
MANNDSLSVQAGQLIFEEGDLGDCAYVIQSGEVLITARTAEGEQVPIGKVGEGELFGEMVLIDQSPRRASAMALVPTQLLVVPRARFEVRLAAADVLLRLFLKVLIERYQDMRENFHRALEGRAGQEVTRRPAPSYIQDSALAKERLEAESELAEALEKQNFQLRYQPIVELSSGRVVGTESLVRWAHPERGLLSPDTFIPLAEESGLILPMSSWIMETGCRDAHEYQGQGGGFVSINLSVRQFDAGTLVQDVAEVLARTGIAPQLVKLEITESLLMRDPENALLTLKGLKALGVMIALDDFGTGYSSFSYLHRFPIDALKIDRSFIATLDSDPKSFEIVRTLCALARAIGMSVIAEGIETAEQAETLRQFGAEFGQGYHFARPMPKSAYLQLLQETPHLGA